MQLCTSQSILFLTSAKNFTIIKKQPAVLKIHFQLILCNVWKPTSFNYHLKKKVFCGTNSLNFACYNGLLSETSSYQRLDSIFIRFSLLNKDSIYPSISELPLLSKTLNSHLSSCVLYAFIYRRPMIFLVARTIAGLENKSTLDIVRNQIRDLTRLWM